MKWLSCHRVIFKFEGEPKTITTTINLSHVSSFEPYVRDGYTQVFLSTDEHYIIVGLPYEKFKELVTHLSK